jgi:ATP-dependent Clp protease ATP-binding subunit ClpB
MLRLILLTRLVPGQYRDPLHYELLLIASSVRVNRETSPEAIDKLQRRKLELEVEIHALEREKDAESKERLQFARKAIAEVEDQLQPLKAAYENEKKRGDEINEVRKKIDELKAKADEAERRCDSLGVS